MFDKMKYIVLDSSWGGERPYMFADHEQHADIAARLKGHNDVVIGAGFIVHNSDGLQCYGRSVSLDINSRPEEDTDLFNRLLGLDT